MGPPGGSPSSRCSAPRSGGASSDWRRPGPARSVTTSNTCPWRSSPVPTLDYRLGVDVGGTNTDAVILDRSDQVLAKAKVPTTPDVTGGIVAALDKVIGMSRAAAVPARKDGPPEPRAVSRITHAMLGTTHATNAVLERRKLHRVAVIRIGAPATLGVRPMFEWPADLTGVVSAGATVGGRGDGGVCPGVYP